MGGAIPAFGNIFNAVGQIGSGGGGSSGAGTSINPTVDQPTQAQSNVLTNPLVASEQAMGQGQTQRRYDPGQWPVTPTFQQPPQQAQPQAPPATPAQTNTAPQATISQGTTGPQATAGYGGGQQTQETPAPAPTTITPPSAPGGYYGGGQQTQETLPSAQAPASIDPSATAAVGNAATTPPATVGQTRKIGDIARRAAGVLSNQGQPPRTGYYPDVAGSAREAGAGPPPVQPQVGGGGANPLQAISDLLLRGPQAFIQDLQGMNQQAGPAYGPSDRTYVPPTAAAAAPAAAAPATAPAVSDAMAPGSAAAAVRAGAEGAAQGDPHRAGEKPPLVLRDPSDPSKGYMPDPNYAAPGSTGEPSGRTGGPPGDNAAPGNAQQSASYIAQHGGYSETGYNQQRGGYGAFKLNPEFSNRLAAAGQAYQKETGQQPQYGLGDRDTETQRFFWEDSRHGTRYAAAPPGQSLHQKGLAMDFSQHSGFRDWLKNGNAQRFGLGFPLGNDPYHLQMQDRHGRAYPYAGQVADTPATGQQAGLTAAGGTIPGSQAPVGTRTADQFYNPSSYIRATVGIESSGNPYARTGSNRGLGQFGPQEEREFGITAANRNDPNVQAQALQREAVRNTPILQRALGRNPDPWELYFTHQQGIAGGPALLTAERDQPAYQAIRRFYGSDAIAQRAIYGNIPRDNVLRRIPAKDITAGQFRDFWQSRFNRDYVPASPRAEVNPTRMPIRLAGDINPDIANMVQQRNEELERDRRRNAILAGRPTIEEGSNRGGSHVPNRRFHPTDIDEFIHKNMGSVLSMTPMGRWLGAVKGAVQPTTVGRDEDVR